MTSAAEQETRQLLVGQLRRFYERGDLRHGRRHLRPGDGGYLPMAPTGVHKELVEPDELFTIDRSTTWSSTRAARDLVPASAARSSPHRL
jgi:hypothetical protein